MGLLTKNRENKESGGWRERCTGSGGEEHEVREDLIELVEGTRLLGRWWRRKDS